MLPDAPCLNSLVLHICFLLNANNMQALKEFSLLPQNTVLCIRRTDTEKDSGELQPKFGRTFMSPPIEESSCLP